MKNSQLQSLQALLSLASSYATVDTLGELDSPVIPEDPDALAEWAESEASHNAGYGSAERVAPLLKLAEDARALARWIREDAS